ncbi:fungal pheromone STE3G-protein-coupled receptor [Peniophora sp. CONT]|nr:fungal pheromone STE3G-protein-coupled receptor [Peniophora sp. CONT]
MGAADPTYPLYPIACILALVMMLLVLATSFVRQSWNLGVTFLCFWLSLENLAQAVNTIIWSDNSDIRLYIFCDIVSHLQIVTFVVKPMATLMITRRLYLIANLQSVEPPSTSARRWSLALEWTLGVIIPILVAGPIYYVNQGLRFEVLEGFGCKSAFQTSILDLLILESWSIIPPLVSITASAKVSQTYYRHRKDIHSFLKSDSSGQRTNYLRILILASIDILLTLPIGIVNITLNIRQAVSLNAFRFYLGWTFLHTPWEPEGFSYAELQTLGAVDLPSVYFAYWTSPALAFAIFAIFGLTSEARASYWRIICTVAGWFDWKPSSRAQSRRMSLGEIEFGVRAQNTSDFDLEMGWVPYSVPN